MKVFVFGAGASAGSQDGSRIDNGDLQSPLTDDIFEEKYHKSAAQVSLSKDEISRIKNLKKAKGWFENWLTEAWNNKKAKKAPERFPASVRTLASAAGRYLVPLKNEMDKSTSEIEKGSLIDSIELCDQILQAVGKLPPEAKKTKN